MLVLLIAQLAALATVLARLAPGRTRRPPAEPASGGAPPGSVSVIAATLNEARRIRPCLAGLARQGPEMREAIIVDSRSSDGTGAIVREASAGEPRIGLVNDPPLPDGWVGKVWALQHGLSLATGEWVLCVDADTEPAAGMVGGVVRAAKEGGYGVVSFSPLFAGQSTAEQWLQPALLLTLVYRCGAAGAAVDPRRVMANGQCFLARRDLLLAHGGYSSARTSFADDVTLARNLAAAGVRVGFLDGSRLYRVRSYASAGEMWREWGRSIDLKDATSTRRQWLDVLFLVLAQGLPLIVLLTLVLARASGAQAIALAGVNATLLGIRVLMLFALRASYERAGWSYWLSPLADPLAVLRVVLSSSTRKRRWRGREYVRGVQPRRDRSRGE